ncbi:MAG TPA: amino acid permease [Vicinamibacteria bacterium]|nr:amino acid permease [Vicinamibacteria bacterium]
MAESRTTYDRRLNLFDGTMLVIGGIIGAGIFLNPSIVAERTGTAGLTLTVWAIGGAVALIGAMCFGELGARHPQAGGSYVYLREVFGPLPAFLYGWTYLVVVNSGGIAAVGMTFAGYACRLAALPELYIKPVAIGALFLLSAINTLGIRPGATTINIFTVLRLAALAALIATGLIFVSRGGELDALASTEPDAAGSGGLLGIVGAALLPVLFSYGGWQHSNHVAGEIARPEENLPRALLAGVTVVVTVYMLANVAYLHALGVEGLASSTAPAADTMTAVVGPMGGSLMGVGIMCSTFGFLSLVILAGPRIYQAMADDGVFFAAAARLHPRYRTPAGAIVVQGIWAVVLILSGTYGQLLDYVVFGDWIFFGLTVATLFIYRRRGAAPNGTAVYVWGYPWTPTFFVLISIFAVVSSVLSNPTNAAIGTVLIGLGVPVFLFWKRKDG